MSIVTYRTNAESAIATTRRLPKLLTTFLLIYFPPKGVQNSAIKLSVAYVRLLGNSINHIPNFTKFCTHVVCGVWSWHSPRLTAVQCVMYFRFCA